VGTGKLSEAAYRVVDVGTVVTSGGHNSAGGNRGNERRTSGWYRRTNIPLDYYNRILAHGVLELPPQSVEQAILGRDLLDGRGGEAGYREREKKSALGQDLSNASQ